MIRSKTHALSGTLALFFLVCLIGTGAMAVEKPKYEILEHGGEYELRKYPPQVVAETLVVGSFDEAGNVGFRRLFGYISGKNRGGPSIKMTSPVTLEDAKRGVSMTAPLGHSSPVGSWRITFMMPSEYSLAELPAPADEEVVLTEDPERTVAVISYSGSWSTERYLAKKKLLEDYIAGRGLNAVGEPVWARYDPPFMPWFLRRNEILIPVVF